MAGKRGISPGPWRVEYRQHNVMGEASRPRVVDCLGTPIGGRAPDAELMAVSPELLEMVASLLNLAEMQALQVASALELAKRPAMPIVDEGKRLLARLSAVGVRP
jgi:hypothetical protein